MEKDKKRCKDFLIGRKPKIDKNTQGKKQKMIVIEQLAVSNSTVLNQELNWGSTDWNKEAELIKSLLSQPIRHLYCANMYSLRVRKTRQDCSWDCYMLTCNGYYE